MADNNRSMILFMNKPAIGMGHGMLLSRPTCASNRALQSTSRKKKPKLFAGDGRVNVSVAEFVILTFRGRITRLADELPWPKVQHWSSSDLLGMRIDHLELLICKKERYAGALISSKKPTSYDFSVAHQAAQA